MPFNVLLLPLLGGYVFITHWNRTRFDANRHSGERLVFHAAIAGVFLLICSFAIARTLIHFFPAIYEEWKEMVPFAYTGTSLGAFVIGCLLWWPLNRYLYPEEREIRRTISNWKNHLEELLEKALRETKQVSLTIRSGKVYVGFITSNLNPAYERKYIQILPMSSGFRSADDQTIQFNTDYARVYRQIIQENTAHSEDGAADFEIVIPVSEIVSANLFDPEAYARFQTGGGSI